MEEEKKRIKEEKGEFNILFPITLALLLTSPLILLHFSGDCNNLFGSIVLDCFYLVAFIVLFVYTSRSEDWLFSSVLLSIFLIVLFAVIIYSLLCGRILGGIVFLSLYATFSAVLYLIALRHFEKIYEKAKIKEEK